MPPVSIADRLDLLSAPTPLLRLDRVSELLPRPAPRIWMKRDDLTPLAFGGNKLRKLEFLLAEAIAAKADVVVTLGAEQSNHACQTACAARRLGLDAILLLRAEADVPRRGNLRLDELAGAELRFDPMPSVDWGERVVEELRAKGRRPYLIPYGGSNALGVLGYFEAAQELNEQISTLGLEPIEIVVASSSGGTQAGLHLAYCSGRLPIPVLGVSADLNEAGLGALVDELARAAAIRFGLPRPEAPIHVTDEFVGPGYAKSDARTEEAIRFLAGAEGIFVDPVYTGKAFAGLLELARRGRWPEGRDLVFWHTGGLPALLV